jgi:hypothetical protein
MQFKPLVFNQNYAVSNLNDHWKVPKPSSSIITNIYFQKFIFLNQSMLNAKDLLQYSFDRLIIQVHFITVKLDYNEHSFITNTWL